MTVMAPSLSEPLWVKQSKNQVNHEAYCDEAGKRIVKDHRTLLKVGRRRTRNRSTARRRRPPRPAGSDPTFCLLLAHIIAACKVKVRVSRNASRCRQRFEVHDYVLNSAVTCTLGHKISRRNKER